MGFPKEEGEGWATPGGGGTEEGKGRVAQREGIESGLGVNSMEKERDQGKGGRAGPKVRPAGGRRREESSKKTVGSRRRARGTQRGGVQEGRPGKDGKARERGPGHKRGP